MWYTTPCCGFTRAIVQFGEESLVGGARKVTLFIQNGQNTKRLLCNTRNRQHIICPDRG